MSTGFKDSSAGRATLGALAAILLGLSAESARAQAGEGEKLFNGLCVACHTVGGGKRVGPDLKGVLERRSEAWLLKFIKSSQTVIASGDPDATKLFAEFNKTPMPDVVYTEAQIKEILAFIGAASAPGAAPPPPPPPLREPTPEEIKRGGDLFQGLARLENSGPPCNSCHHVKNDAVIGGGVLAKELTQVFSRMGAPGVQAILGTPPFPVMETAYKGRPLTEPEVAALVGFLQDADKNHAFQQPVDYGLNLVLAGTGVFAVLAALYALIWRRRRVRPVNYEIFERQVQSE